MENEKMDQDQCNEEIMGVMVQEEDSGLFFEKYEHSNEEEK